MMHANPTLPASIELSEVYRIRSLATIPEKYMADESHLIGEIETTKQEYESAIDKQNSALAFGRKLRLEQLCVRYIDEFSRYTKDQ